MGGEAPILSVSVQMKTKDLSRQLAKNVGGIFVLIFSRRQSWAEWSSAGKLTGSREQKPLLKGNSPVRGNVCTAANRVPVSGRKGVRQGGEVLERHTLCRDKLWLRQSFSQHRWSCLGDLSVTACAVPPLLSGEAKFFLRVDVINKKQRAEKV